MTTSITNPRASVSLPAAETTRAVPTTGATATSRPCASSSVKPSSTDGSKFMTYEAAGASTATRAANRASMCSRALSVPWATDTAVISARVLSTGVSSGMSGTCSRIVGRMSGRTVVIRPDESCQYLTVPHQPLTRCAFRLLGRAYDPQPNRDTLLPTPDRTQVGVSLGDDARRVPPMRTRRLVPVPVAVALTVVVITLGLGLGENRTLSTTGTAVAATPTSSPSVAPNA